MRRNKRMGVQDSVMYCPYCGGRVHLRSAEGIYVDNFRDTMLYVCKNYPSCDTYVRVHAGTNIPVGTMANKKLRAMRKEAHHYLDKLHKQGFMKKQEVYQWLADTLHVSLSMAHVGYLGEYNCAIVIEESRRLLEQLQKKRARNRNERKEKAVCS